MEIKHKRHKEKGKRFEKLISKADLALKSEFYLETSWICYSIMEERLKGLVSDKLNLAISDTNKNFFGYLEGLNASKALNPKIEEYFSYDFIEKLNIWRLERNRVMKVLAEEDIPTQELEKLGKDSRKLLSELTKQIMKFKKYLTKLQKLEL